MNKLFETKQYGRNVKGINNWTVSIVRCPEPFEGRTSINGSKKKKTHDNA